MPGICVNSWESIDSLTDQTTNAPTNQLVPIHLTLRLSKSDSHSESRLLLRLYLEHGKTETVIRYCWGGGECSPRASLPGNKKTVEITLIYFDLCHLQRGSETIRVELIVTTAETENIHSKDNTDIIPNNFTSLSQVKILLMPDSTKLKSLIAFVSK